MQLHRSRQAPSRFGQLLRRRLAILVATAVGFLLVTAAISVGLVPSTSQAPKPATAPASTTAGASAVDSLLARHDCWRGQAPPDMQGQIPGGVVVTRASADAPAYGGAAMVARALDHVFSGKHPDLVVHGFCRGWPSGTPTGSRWSSSPLLRDRHRHVVPDARSFGYRPARARERHGHHER